MIGVGSGLTTGSISLIGTGVGSSLGSLALFLFFRFFGGETSSGIMLSSGSLSESSVGFRLATKLETFVLKRFRKH